MEPLQYKGVCLLLQGSEVLSQSGVLSLKAVSYQDSGEYQCVAAVPSVPGLTSTASLSITVTGTDVASASLLQELM